MLCIVLDCVWFSSLLMLCNVVPLQTAHLDLQLAVPLRSKCRPDSRQQTNLFLKHDLCYRRDRASTFVRQKNLAFERRLVRYGAWWTHKDRKNIRELMLGPVVDVYGSVIFLHPLTPLNTLLQSHLWNHTPQTSGLNAAA